MKRFLNRVSTVSPLRSRPESVSGTLSKSRPAQESTAPQMKVRIDFEPDLLNVRSHTGLLVRTVESKPSGVSFNLLTGWTGNGRIIIL